MHHAKKRFGQNFLIDQSIINQIVDCIRPQTDDVMIEIGPGLGAITKPLLKELSHLDVIELDRDIIPKLINSCTFSDPENKDKLSINEIDVLKFDFEAFRQRRANAQGIDRKLRVVGNLPYNISTPVLFHLLKYRHHIQDMHFMLQKEVVDRIVSEPRNKHYGRLSVMLQTFCSAESLFEVPPYAFEPAPKVDSAILRLRVNDTYEERIDDFSSYEKLIRQAFSQRRKTLRNTLKGLCTEKDFEAASLSPGQRAEELSVADFVRLHEVLN
jgi:16S rRNA (adenine1518-N6/adenine1519-N6)-dimethyltransferase